MVPFQRARPPDLYDVARLAGVSHQTVSRVVNHHPHVRVSTRHKVMTAIAELGYRSNAAARTLVTRRSNTIGVITSAAPLWGPIGTLVALERAARDTGFGVNVAGMASIDPAVVDATLRRFVDQGVDGIVVVAPEAAVSHIAEPFVTDVPVVLVAAGAEPAVGVQIAAVDQEGGARAAVRHLVDLGHREIAHISGPEPWFDATARLRGWRRELSAHDLPAEVLLSGDWSSASGYAAGARLIRRGPVPTAVFVANDLMAIGVIKALRHGGLRVPQDVSVVGFDDMPGVDFLAPSLTTVRQDLDALGRLCIDMLTREPGSPTAAPTTVPAALVVRGSTAGPVRDAGWAARRPDGHTEPR
ncbi:LacI family transcriptional regulator [Nakamurella flava]|uniref:LacI family transcriptional regulator n=1 Tax=Nakamurella flava TaxID=2576308 RepID=A0A4U6QBQ3_9ACTN|nr:LacI family transcriptional regulator [Nakamurella flava]